MARVPWWRRVKLGVVGAAATVAAFTSGEVTTKMMPDGARRGWTTACAFASLHSWSVKVAASHQ